MLKFIRVIKIQDSRKKDGRNSRKLMEIEVCVMAKVLTNDLVSIHFYNVKLLLNFIFSKDISRN